MPGTRHQGDWDLAARGYARQEHLELRAFARALDLLAPRPHELLVDTGTGTGLLLRELARRPERPVRALGFDASAGMLDRVGPLPAGWRVAQADATALPLPDGAADVGTAAYLLHVLDPGTRAAAVAELRRVVKPGGRVVVLTPWSHRAPVRAALAVPARLAPGSLIGLTPLDPRPELVAAGFRLVRAARLHRGYPTLVVLAR